MLSHSAGIHLGTRRSGMQLANHPPINFPTEVGDREPVPIHANEPNHLQNSEHRSQCARWQILAVAAPRLFGPDFLDERIEADRLSMRSQNSEDARGCFRAGKELHQCIFQPLEVSREPRRRFGRPETGRCRIHVAMSWPPMKSSAKGTRTNDAMIAIIRDVVSIVCCVSLQMKGCGIITGAAICAAAGPRGRAGLCRLDDLIHLAIDVSAAEEKQC